MITKEREPEIVHILAQRLSLLPPEKLKALERLVDSLEIKESGCK